MRRDGNLIVKTEKLENSLKNLSGIFPGLYFNFSFYFFFFAQNKSYLIFLSPPSLPIFSLYPSCSSSFSLFSFLFTVRSIFIQTQKISSNFLCLCFSYFIRFFLRILIFSSKISIFSGILWVWIWNLVPLFLEFLF